MEWKRLIKANRRQVFFVFAAFFLMALTSYFSVSVIVERRMIQGTEAAIRVAELNVSVGLSETEATLNNMTRAVREMIEKGESRDGISKYFKNTTEWLRERDSWRTSFHGAFGYIQREFIDDAGLIDPIGFTPQTRPWFDAAVRNSGKSTIYTEPYVHWRDRTIVLTAIRNLYGSEGQYYGILGIDMSMSWLQEYVQKLYTADDSYGVILDPYMVTIAHPQSAYIGLQLQNMGKGYRAIYNELMRGVSSMKVEDVDGVSAIVSFFRMFNGWYIGVVTPYNSYYMDVYVMAAILSALGFILMAVLSGVLLQLSAAKERSDEKNRSKSSFLARMSHEIRTPMNAVIGLGELGLRMEDLPPPALEYFAGIRQAGRNLLSIINDILDFSKIEAGGLEITSFPYTLASLLNDVVNVARVRLLSKPILFLVNVESAIPNNLVGDETHVRQVLLNLLSNAMKYTEKGFVKLSVSFERTKNGSILLKFQVADSGIGIKPEDMEGLFGDFVRLDAERNKGVEGTGLGLVIVKKLCLAMDGNVTVESVYGQGSVFTAVIPHKHGGGRPVASVDDAGGKSVLLYDERVLYAESIATTLKDLGVDVAVAVGQEEFVEKLTSGDFRFTFVSSRVAGQLNAIISGAKLKTELVLLADLDEASSFWDSAVVLMPAYAVSIANALNHETPADLDGKAGKFEARFTAPEAKVLLVDDMSSNLLVAKGLMAPYRVAVTLCGSGREAVELARKERFDVIFMDHMMPGMDGIEATAAIRALGGKRLPIIALTANAVSGMKEMFLQNGMNDFLSKPIDPGKLEAVLRRWIPEEKRRRVKTGASGAYQKHEKNAVFRITGLNVEKGVFLTGGTEVGYITVLGQYCRDADSRMEFIDFSYAERDLRKFTTQVHALKSVLASIGASELSRMAAFLEDAAESGDMGYIRACVDGFRQKLFELTARVRAVLETRKTEAEGKRDILDSAMLTRLKGALEKENISEVNGILRGLEGKFFDEETMKTLSEIDDLILMFDFEDAIEALDGLLEGAGRLS
ncbi:MAG: response regulator [Synergistaceae bacterium]|jgi:signal transduction histidine kinase/DNA-binding response OmpR family regulator|nr:response regulator [Synergistaceae bacterium]